VDNLLDNEHEVKCSTASPTKAPNSSPTKTPSSTTPRPTLYPTPIPTSSPTPEPDVELRIAVMLLGVKDDQLQVDGLGKLMQDHRRFVLPNSEVFTKTAFKVRHFQNQIVNRNVTFMRLCIFQVGELLPKSWSGNFEYGSDFKFVSYHGSDTKPPCKENVAWLIAAEPVQVGEGSLNKLRELQMW
jgi:hypothetical protein